MRCDRCQLNGICRKLREATREHFRWSMHNLVAHPLSEIAYLIGLRKLSDRLHDASVPKHLVGVELLMAVCLALSSCSSLPQPSAIKAGVGYNDRSGDASGSIEVDFPLASPKGYRK